MSRRVSLPGADELFRPTKRAAGDDETATVANVSPISAASASAPDEAMDAPGKRAPSGRIRHDEKITVYVTADELVDLEGARLALRRDHALAVDRGRLVREAIHLAIEDVEAAGEESALVRRLREQ